MSTTTTEERECACTHPDALTCWARQHHTTRFNALFIGCGSNIERAPGMCPCLCHRDAAHKAPSKNRNTGKNFAGKSEVLS